jgi:hypothetical protein
MAILLGGISLLPMLIQRSRDLGQPGPVLNLFQQFRRRKKLDAVWWWIAQRLPTHQVSARFRPHCWPDSSFSARSTPFRSIFAGCNSTSLRSDGSQTAETGKDSRASEKQDSKKVTRLGIKGVTLHSYRYAWAERAKTAGYPERFAMENLGHNSKAVHRAYPLQWREDFLPFIVATNFLTSDALCDIRFFSVTPTRSVIE